MCPNCEKECPPGASHCPYCGTAQATPSPTNAMVLPQAPTFCVKCGASLTTDAAFCIRCGTARPGPGGVLKHGSTARALAKSKREKMLGGVCGGVALYLGVNPLVLRLAFVISMFLSFGISLIAYIALWVRLPADPASS